MPLILILILILILELSEFQASLVFKASSGTARTKPCLKNNNEMKKITTTL